MGKPRSAVGTVRVVGPLALYVGDFESFLTERGYSPWTRVAHLGVMSHLSRWLQAGGLGVEDLTGQRIGQYLDQRSAAGYRRFCSVESVSPLLSMLKLLGVLPAEESAPGSPIDVLLAGFYGYLMQERGLASSTAVAYSVRARRFVVECRADGDLQGLTSAEVTRAVLRESVSVSVGSVQYFVAALRSFLRYCHVVGLIETDLSAAALSMTGRRRSSLPKRISQADAQALLQSCDGRGAAGRRDYAILLMLLRLGLRAGEVAALRLEDLDWRAGQIVVHGKGSRIDRLPMPVDVGEAIVGYLSRGRPQTSRREVFLRSPAPRIGLSRRGVTLVVRQACLRAGVAPVGAHRLRHTLACQMIGSGVPLGEIGQVFRHNSEASTAVYARVDIDQLRAVARAWPLGADR